MLRCRGEESGPGSRLVAELCPPGRRGQTSQPPGCYLSWCMVHTPPWERPGDTPGFPPVSPRAAACPGVVWTGWLELPSPIAHPPRPLSLQPVPAALTAGDRRARCASLGAGPPAPSRGAWPWPRLAEEMPRAEGVGRGKSFHRPTSCLSFLLHPVLVSGSNRHRYHPMLRL